MQLNRWSQCALQYQRMKQFSSYTVWLFSLSLLTACSNLPVQQATQAQPGAGWNNSYQSRLEVLALMQGLNATILGSSSATASLQQWCADHHMAAEARISARLMPGAANPPTPEQLQRLQVNSPAETRYRLVQLSCGNKVLSIAENWYVPARLTADMNHQLDNTDTPFGKAVQPLAPFRRTFEVKVLWSPLPQGWELVPTASRQAGDKVQQPLAIPAELFSHRAILYSKDNLPIAEVSEHYQGTLLDFKRPAAAALP